MASALGNNSPKINVITVSKNVAHVNDIEGNTCDNDFINKAVLKIESAVDTINTVFRTEGSV